MVLLRLVVLLAACQLECTRIHQEMISREYWSERNCLFVGIRMPRIDQAVGSLVNFS